MASITTNLERVVKVFCEENRPYIKMYDDINTMQDLIDIWGWGSTELKGEIEYVINHSKELSDVWVTDDLEVMEDNGELHTYRALSILVRRFRF